jgi:hypothetical protein
LKVIPTTRSRWHDFAKNVVPRALGLTCLQRVRLGSLNLAINLIGPSKRPSEEVAHANREVGCSPQTLASWTSTIETASAIPHDRERLVVFDKFDN